MQLFCINLRLFAFVFANFMQLFVRNHKTGVFFCPKVFRYVTNTVNYPSDRKKIRDRPVFFLCFCFVFLFLFTYFVVNSILFLFLALFFVYLFTVFGLFILTLLFLAFARFTTKKKQQRNRTICVNHTRV